MQKVGTDLYDVTEIRSVELTAQICPKISLRRNVITVETVTCLPASLGKQVPNQVGNDVSLLQAYVRNVGSLAIRISIDNID